MDFALNTLSTIVPHSLVTQHPSLDCQSSSHICYSGCASPVAHPHRQRRGQPTAVGTASCQPVTQMWSPDSKKAPVKEVNVTSFLFIKYWATGIVKSEQCWLSWDEQITYYRDLPLISFSSSWDGAWGYPGGAGLHSGSGTQVAHFFDSHLQREHSCLDLMLDLMLKQPEAWWWWYSTYKYTEDIMLSWGKAEIQLCVTCDVLAGQLFWVFFRWTCTGVVSGTWTCKGGDESRVFIL